jgi:hypothetical protein
MSDQDPDEYLYETLNKGLLRERRTGSFTTKRINKNGPFVPFNELPDYEFDPDDFFGAGTALEIEFLANRDNNGEPEEHTNPQDGSQTLKLTRPLSEKEKDELLAKHFEVVRVQVYEDINEHRERRGLQPWYILTKEELDLVGLCLPYSLAIFPSHRHVKRKIEQEGQRIKELREKGVVEKPWSTWKDED